ncbi:uncharacterized protein M421DRAFT_106085 [Didymella exigua CBS 183.55]|uniref:Uncharacterized protein n=1 Tax=Didymella exigua CBS 183.55 TaxID=1150837 RepID=A0A6A5S8I8_9PLEO|nr:uncharacterized protein M421DRAFT_106085 [Didymella exigua CBS 183.55]KAF1933827.1 hypothetical protein M421DRAFT_106085 [Didymella exigua CBS 183.55]
MHHSIHNNLIRRCVVNTFSRRLLSIITASLYGVNCGAPPTSLIVRRQRCSPSYPISKQERVPGCRSQSAPTPGGLITYPQSLDATALLSDGEHCMMSIGTKASCSDRPTAARIEAPCVSPGRPSNATPARHAASHHKQGLESGTLGLGCKISYLEIERQFFVWS